MALLEALQELKTEVLNGKTVEAVVDSIARDFDVHPKLLARKFAESYGSVETLKANAVAMDEKIVMASKTTEEVARVCNMYGVSPASCHVTRRGGNDYTVIGRLGNRIVAVRHRDAWHCQWRIR